MSQSSPYRWFKIRMSRARRDKLEEIAKEQSRIRNKPVSMSQLYNDATDEKYPELKEVK